MTLFKLVRVLVVLIVNISMLYGLVKWDPDPLEPQFWQPAKLIEGFTLEHVHEHPCSVAKEAIQIEGLFGRLNNYLIELVHMLEVAVLSERKYILVIGSHYREITGNHIDIFNTTRLFACVKRYDSPEARALRIIKVNVKQIYRQRENVFNDFRGNVLSRLLLSPSSRVREDVELFIRQNKLTSGFNAIHLRGMEGKCLKEMTSRFHHSYTYAFELGRNITEVDICDMTNDYVRWKLMRAGTSHLPLVIAHDDQNRERLHDLLCNFNAVTTRGGQRPEDVIADMVLLLRANTFVPNLVSTFSDNIQHARRVIHSNIPRIS